MATSNFDSIAPYYDRLVRLVFGMSIQDSQLLFLSVLKDSRQILVLGGGTGKFLDVLLDINPHCHIWFIDASAEMINLAKQNTSSERIFFICGTEQSIPPGPKFDAVITFYFLDLFRNEDLAKIVGTVKGHLTTSSLWVAADFFDNGNWWQTPLLQIMYFFFRIVSGLKTRKLPLWIEHLEAAGFKILESKSQFSGFIKTVVFKAS